MKNFVQHGDASVTVIAPAAVLSGGIVIVGSLIGVASANAASGAEVEIKTSGVFDLTADSAATATVGARAYATPAGVVNATAAGNKLLGVFLAAKTAGQTVARVRLDGISA